MVSINTVIQEKQHQTLNSIFSSCILFHIYLQCVIMHIFRNECVCTCTLTLPPSLRNYNTSIHSEALILRSVKQKILLSYTISNKLCHFLIFFIILHFICCIGLSQNAKSCSRLIRLARDHLFLSSTQPPFRESFFMILFLNSFLLPILLINLFTQGELQGSWQCNNS